MPTNTSNRETVDELRIELPWPDSALSPNARLHWRAKAVRTKVARKTAWAISMEAGARQLSVSATPRVSIEFRPPDRRRRDADNCMASLKASLDGIADALRIDDSRFISNYKFGEPVKGGAVHVTIRGA